MTRLSIAVFTRKAIRTGKVSVDGVSWDTGLEIDSNTGKTTLPNGAEITGALTGTAVQQSATDDTAGRLLAISGTNGAFGLGSTALEYRPGSAAALEALTLAAEVRERLAVPA